MNLNEVEKSVYDGLVEKNYDKDDFVKYLSFVLAIRDIYQSFHWGTTGSDFYEDHLLFERLYGELAEQADEVAEKFVGLSDSEVACPVMLSRTRCDIYDNLMEDFSISHGGNTLVLRAIFVEQAFLKISEALYDKLEESGNLTLGLDDMLASIYSKHEDNIYLLKQKVVVNNVGQND
jgi:hypothetical protein